MSVRRAIIEGLLITLFGIAVCFFLLPQNAFIIDANCHLNGFARRWDGSCSGWTQGEALFHVIGDLLHWWAYATAAMVILRLHPIMAKVPSSRAAVYLMVAFIFGCGITHLFEAYTTFNPVYIFQGWFKLVNGIVSIIGAYFIAHALVRAFAEVMKRRKQLEEFESK